ncbi:phosphogluconate dehydratase [Rhodoblastus sp.]|jgi:phosphogluconate dehydratase|uniref:phosphogluconate dehydratase n=1 Tax=Rhodoblastus sp. TaxID=1962975 RepID=UPI002621E14D|nr:phosphogluconate dehydratase [Rhodoblastus sp.]
MASLNERIGEVAEAILRRSRDGRARYLDRIDSAASRAPRRRQLGCANQAHGFAACAAGDKALLREGSTPNLGIVTAYNDMLSAHKPYEAFPELIRAEARAIGATAQVAGGVPAMCDGITQGEAGMELSLFSRDVIALATAVALSHQTFDAAALLGICDKIVPGLVIGALSFGHLPAIFIPSGPMPSGVPNAEKNRVRQLFAEGKVDRAALLEVEARSYHAPGTCTFYGTANTNQMLMEFMGLHLPGASFVHPDTPLRDALTRAAVRQVLGQTASGPNFLPIGRMIDERSFVNAIVGLAATGGSTNAVIHLVAMAAAAGLTLDLRDFEAIAEVTPLLARVYPNGQADVNQFHAAGGTVYLIRELLDAGLLHEDARTVFGGNLGAYRQEPILGADGRLDWRDGPGASGDEAILRTVRQPFGATGGLRILEGNLGRAVIKTSAVSPERHVVEAPALVFHSQEAFQAAFKAGRLERDFVAVIRFQGPRAIGMPELHKLTPPLGVLQDRGFKVALVTDGRMSGASGKAPAAIHLTPEALDDGPIAKIRDGDLIRLDASAGTLTALVPESEWANRPLAREDLSAAHAGTGRELFSTFRAAVGRSDQGASIFSGRNA